jgi:hypothetical protein
MQLVKQGEQEIEHSDHCSQAGLDVGGQAMADALDQLQTVAQAAGVSTAWLYLPANRDIADQIKELRAQQQAEPKVVIPAHLRASDASKDSLLTVMRQKVKDLEAENADLRRQIGELRKQLEVAYELVHAQL